MEKLNKLIHLILDKIKFLIISFLSREEKFRFIYKNQYWKNRKGGSLSGAGSNLSSTATLIGELNRFLETKNIKYIGGSANGLSEKANFYRMVLLYNYGGCWFDLDCFFYRNDSRPTLGTKDILYPCSFSLGWVPILFLCHA